MKMKIQKTNKIFRKKLLLEKIKKINVNKGINFKNFKKKKKKKKN